MVQHLLSLLEESFCDESSGKLMWCSRSTAGCRQWSCVSLPVLMDVQVLVCWRSSGELKEEQWTGCARGVIWQWVTVTEITIENHSRPSTEVPLVESAAWTLGAWLGSLWWQLGLAGCLGLALENVSDFSIFMRGSAKVKNCLKAHECLHLCKTWTVCAVTPVLCRSRCREVLPTVSLLYLWQVDKS